MKPATPRTACALLVLAALACNLGASGAGQSPATPAVATVAPAAIAAATPPLTPTQEPSPTPEPFSTPDPTPFVTGLAANLQARVASGEWTLEEGLVTTLKFLAGEVNIEAIGQAGVELHSYAGSGVVRMARSYLQTGADEVTKTEIRRLISLILPDAETLKRFAQPAQAQTGGIGYLARPSVQMEECRALWEDGWPEGSTATCFEYRLVEANGGTYEIFYPLDWPAGDPRRAFFEPTVDAVRDSARTFSRFGAMPASTTIVFTLLPDPEVPGAYAVTDQTEENGTCQVAILPPGTGLSEGAYKQTVAHELFHCYQLKNYWAQMGNSHNDWWVEGTAEYFGNVVYPTVNAESEFWPGFDVNSINKSLLAMDYDNVVFFQYLANRVGDEGVLQMIQSMPDSGGRSAEMAHLAAYPDIENLFHSFAKAYLDRQILDTGGGLVGIRPRVDSRRIFDASRTEFIPTNSFVVTRAVFVFPERKRYMMAEEGADGLMTAAKPLDADGWAALPTELVTSCGELAYVYTITKASATEGEQEVGIRVDVEDEDFEEGSCDRCVVGRWELDITSHWEAFLSVLPSEMNTRLESITGAVTAIFTDRGSMTINLDSFDIRYTQDFSGNHVEADLNMNGMYQSTWYTDREAGTLFSLNPTSGPVFSGEARLTRDGQTVTQPVQQPPFISGVSLYQCSDDTLLIDSFTPSGVDGQFVTWQRLSTSP